MNKRINKEVGWLIDWVSKYVCYIWVVSLLVIVYKYIVRVVNNLIKYLNYEYFSFPNVLKDEEWYE